MQENQDERSKLKRGFAAMSLERRREIASLGGTVAHKKGVAHQWDSQQAAAAGRKGGLNSGKKRAF